jgi:hypothetical protein
MAEQNNGGSSVNVVAIVAVLVLVGVGAWFFMGQRSQQAATTPTKSEESSDFKVKIELPDSVTVTP